MKKQVAVDDEKYSVIYSNRNNLIIVVRNRIKANNKIYSCTISRQLHKVNGKEIQATRSSWEYKSDEEVAEFLKSLNISGFINNLF